VRVASGAGVWQRENIVVGPLLGQPRLLMLAKRATVLPTCWKIKVREGWAGGEVSAQGQ
jgi:hypothetical protein